MTDDYRIPDDQWATIVDNVPIVSVDLVVHDDGGIVLGKRQNEPGRGDWFVPGGTVRKNESLDEAVHRIADEELGVSVRIDRRLGAYEHFWDVADTGSEDGKHYVPIGYEVSVTDGALETDAQHSDLQTFYPPSSNRSPPLVDLDLHPYVRDYLADAGVLDSADA